MKDLTKNRYAENRYVEVTKEFRFESAHFLNEYVGDCSRMHGHSYRLQVSARGIVDRNGFVIDFKELKSLVKDEIVDKWDHHVLNSIFPFNPTAENMVVFIFDTLHKMVKLQKSRYSICSVRLWETDTSYAEYRGEQYEFFGGKDAVL